MLQAFSNRRDLKISERSEVIFEYPKNLVDFCDSEVKILKSHSKSEVKIKFGVFNVEEI